MTLTFIVSGKLWRNAMVMQDEETESLWSHLTGRALDGTLAEHQLELVPSVQTTWAAWVAEHPDTKLLRKEEAVTASRYAAYFSDPERMGLFRTDWLQERMPGKARVHGITRGPHAVAVTDERLVRGTLLHITVGDDPVLVTRTADGGIRAYVARAGDTVLHFAPAAGPNTATDAATGSTWDLVLGVARSGPLEGTALEDLVVQTAFWFAWSVFYPNTQVVD